MNKTCLLFFIVIFDLSANSYAKDNRVSVSQLEDNAPSKTLNKSENDQKRKEPISGLYCFLGTDSEKYTNNVTYMHPNTLVWSKKDSTLDPPRAYAGGVVNGSTVYLIGGMTIHDFVRPILEAYDCSKSSSTQLKEMPEERYGLGAALLKGDIYVTGGYNQNTVKLNSSLKYNAKDNQWSEIEPMRVPRAAHQLMELNGKLYAIDGNGQHNAEKYDPTTGKWTWITAPNYPHSWFSAAAHHKRIYVLSQTGFEVYTPETNSWKVLRSPTTLWGMSLVSMNGWLWALGGSEHYAAHKEVYTYDVANEGWHQEKNPMFEGKAYHFCAFVE